MDFSKVPGLDLLQFLIDHPEVPIRGGTLIQQVQNLFQTLQLKPDPVYPEIISDLHHAFLISSLFEDDSKYTFEQIQKLTPQELSQFQELLRLPSNASRSRIYRLLYFLDRISEFSIESMLAQELILANVCQNLTFEQALKLQVNKKLTNINCEFKINDSNNHIKSLPGINSDTKLLYRLIQKYGSEQTIYYLISFEFLGKKFKSLVSELSLPDRIRLIKILLERVTKIDPMVFRDLLEYSFEESSEILELLLQHGADPTVGNEQGFNLLVPAMSYLKNSIPNVKLMLKYGANPNSWVNNTYLDSPFREQFPGGLSILRFAEIYGKPEVVELLKQAGAHA